MLQNRRDINAIIKRLKKVEGTLYGENDRWDNGICGTVSDFKSRRSDIDELIKPLAEKQRKKRVKAADHKRNHAPAWSLTREVSPKSGNVIWVVRRVMNDSDDYNHFGGNEEFAQKPDALKYMKTGNRPSTSYNSYGEQIKDKD